jgi:hypothetical protein
VLVLDGSRSEAKADQAAAWFFLQQWPESRVVEELERRQEHQH